jgi:hypothetical protein
MAGAEDEIKYLFKNPHTNNNYFYGLNESGESGE